MKNLILFAMVLCCLTASGTLWAQPSLRIVTEELPPFNFEKDSEVRGISTDVLLKILGMAGAPAERSAIEILPWPRAYRTVQEEAGTVLYSAARTEEREPLFKWVGPISTVTIGLIAPKKKNIVIGSIEDARKYRIGSIRDGAPEQLAIKAGIDADSMDRIARPDLNIQKLASGRIDLFSFNFQTAKYLMREMGLDPAEYEVVYPLKTAQLYFAFHKAASDDLIRELNDALEALKRPSADGSSPFDAIVGEYLGKTGL